MIKPKKNSYKLFLVRQKLLWLFGIIVSVTSVAIAQTAPKIADTLSVKKDSLGYEEIKLNIKKEKGDIETTIKYDARDSIILDVVNQKIYLYGKAVVLYEAISLEAARMEIDWRNNITTAYGVKDSTGKEVGNPVFKEKQDVYVAKKISYNFKTKKGIIYDVVTQQGDGYIHGEKIKKSDTDELYVSTAKYTTCNHPDPHFEINAKKIKVVPDKRIVAGPFNLNIAGIPTPLGFLFGIFPMPKERTSGLIMPTPVLTPDRGFALQNGGYYIPVNDYMNLKLGGEIYTNGSWGLNIVNDYKVRYRYEGAMNFRYNVRVVDETVRSMKDYWVSWRHKPVQREGRNFNAEINFGSSKFNRNNSYNLDNFQSSSFRTNISYSEVIKKTPFNYSIAASSDMNTITGERNFNLPDGSFAMARQFPIKKIVKNSKNSWYNNLNMSYSFNVKNTLSNSRQTYYRERKILRDTILPFAQENTDLLLSRINTSGKHTVPISTTIKTLKYFTLNPYFNYDEFWYLRTYRYAYSDSLKTILTTDTLDNFSRAGTFNTGATLVTRVYGTFFVRKMGIEAIRHVMMPSLNFNFRPDYAKNSNYFQEINYTVNNRPVTEYRSVFGNTALGGPGQGKSGTIGFAINNTFEMKVKDRKDTINKYKKVMLLDNLSLGGTYNLLADSLQLSPISVSARSVIARIINININSVFEPYRYILDSTAGAVYYQRRVNEFAVSKGQGLASLQGFNVAVSTSLNPKANPNNKPNTKNIPKDELEYIMNNPDRYVDFNVPWNMKLGYNLTYNKNGFQPSAVTQVVTVGGEVNVSKTWKVSVNTGLDIIRLKQTITRIDIYKDLHCWEMRFSVIPTGARASVTFDINVKASSLQDLKYSKKNNDWYNR